MAKHIQTGTTAGGDLTGTYPSPTLATTAVTPGAYTNTNLTVDSKGRITAATNGSAGSSTAMACTNLTSGFNSGTISSGTTASITPAAKSLILLTVSIRNNSISPGTPTVSGNGLTWVMVGTATMGTHRATYLFRAMGVAPTAGTVTITLAESDTDMSWVIDQITNVDTSGTNGSGAIVQVATHNDPTGGNTSATATLSTFAKLANATYGSFGTDGNPGPTGGTGFTLVGHGNSSTNITSDTEFDSSPATAVSMSWASGTAYIGVVAVEITANAASSGAVSSVFTRTGAVTAQSGDYTAAQVGALPATDDLSAIASTNATAANVSMNSHKLTSLANGSAASDAAAFGQIPTSASTIGGLLASNNLSDLGSAPTARTNLGLGAVAVLAAISLTANVTGILPVANGGTGSNSSTGSGSTVLSTSPVLTTPNIGTATGSASLNLLLTGGTLSGALTCQTIAPSANSTYNLGSTSNYFQYVYAARHYLNSTAYFDGGTTGQIGVTGILNMAGATANNLTFNNSTVIVTSNAGTCSTSNALNTFTNSSAATMAITISTTGAVDGQRMMVRIYDFSAVAQTIGWTNTENSLVSVPTTSNGSTTLPLTVGFMYNGQTSKWRCVAVA